MKVMKAFITPHNELITKKRMIRDDGGDDDVMIGVGRFVMVMDVG